MEKDDLLIYQLARAQQAVRNNLAGSFAREDIRISPLQARILFALRRKSPLSMGQLSKVLGSDNAAVTRLVDGLVRLDLVKREPSPTDRRTVLVTPSDTGFDEIDRARELIRETDRAVAGCLEPGDREAFFRSLGRILEAFGKDAEARTSRTFAIEIHIEGLEEMCVPHALW